MRPSWGPGLSGPPTSGGRRRTLRLCVPRCVEERCSGRLGLEKKKAGADLPSLRWPSLPRRSRSLTMRAAQPLEAREFDGWHPPG